jgi:hypothetical protein
MRGQGRYQQNQLIYTIIFPSFDAGSVGIWMCHGTHLQKALLTLFNRDQKDR